MEFQVSALCPGRRVVLPPGLPALEVLSADLASLGPQALSAVAHTLRALLLRVTWVGGMALSSGTGYVHCLSPFACRRRSNCTVLGGVLEG